MTGSSGSSLARIRLVAINDVASNLLNLPKLQTFLCKLNNHTTNKKAGASTTTTTTTTTTAVIVCGNFLKSTSLNSIDQGRGVVSAMKSSGITHCCFGHAESKTDLGILSQRIQEMSSTNTNTTTNNNENNDTASSSSAITLINSNIRTIGSDIKQENEYSRIYSNQKYWDEILRSTPSHSIITSSCGRVKIALLGLLEESPSSSSSDQHQQQQTHMFGPGRGCIPIENVLSTYTKSYTKLTGLSKTKDASNNNDDEHGSRSEKLTVAKIMARKKKELLSLQQQQGQEEPPPPQQQNQQQQSAVVDLADYIIPITHQSMEKDQELAKHMLETDRNNNNNNKIGMYDKNKPTRGGGGGGGGIIIAGGHINHHQVDTSSHQEETVTIIKAGDHAKVAALIDLEFEAPTTTTTPEQQQKNKAAIGVPPPPPKLVKVDVDYIDLEDSYEDSQIVKAIIEKRMKVMRDLEQEVLVDLSSSPSSSSHELSRDNNNDNFVLSSDQTRFPNKTSVGTFFCNAIREELQVDVAVLNRSVPQGNTTYPDCKMTYADLKMELPSSSSSSSPTCQIVEVPMTRLQLYKAITYSHMNSKQERDGYLQIDSMYDGSYPAESPDDMIQVALPLNLLFLPFEEEEDGKEEQEGGGSSNKNVGKIQPLIELSKSLRERNLFADLQEDAIPAVDIVTRHCCKNRWVNIIRNNNNKVGGETDDDDDDGEEEGDDDDDGSDNNNATTTIAFGDIDLNNDGVLDKHEIKILLQRVLGYEPDDQVVEDMINSIDVDGNGVIDEDEFGYVLARIERECSSK